MGFLSDMADPQRNWPDATTPQRMRPYSYDQACSDLAVYFLTDGKREIDHDSDVVKEWRRPFRTFAKPIAETLNAAKWAKSPQSSERPPTASRGGALPVRNHTRFPTSAAGPSMEI